MTAVEIVRLSRPELETAVAALRGQVITGVEYALMNSYDQDGDGFTPAEWDFGAFHEPTFGCRLLTDRGAVAFVWDNTFGCYGLEPTGQDIRVLLRDVGEPFAPIVLPVTQHPLWQRLLGRAIAGTALEWADWESGAATPCWVRLDLAEDADGEPASVWIVAGRWDGGRFLFATDDVTVVFERVEALRTGIMS